MVDRGAGALVALPPVEGTALSPLLTDRRSVKEFTDEPLALPEVASLLRHGAGVDGAGRPTYASARSQYLVSVSLVAGDVIGLRPGAYRYLGGRHALRTHALGDLRPGLAAATVDAHWLADVPALLVLSADMDAANDCFAELGPRQGEQFAWLEAGLITQNAYLWAAATGLGTVFIGGLDQAALPGLSAGIVPTGEQVLGLLPVGWPAS